MLKVLLSKIKTKILYRLGRFKYTFFIQRKGLSGIFFVSKFTKIFSLILVKLISKKYYSVLDLSSKNPNLYNNIEYKNYNDYLKIQVVGNEFKKNNKAVKEEDIRVICDFLNYKQHILIHPSI